MKAHDYSQIVLRRAGRLSLVSPEGITNWALRESDSIGLLEPATASIGDVGANEPKGSCRFMGPDQTVDEARAAFVNGSSASSTRLYAILVIYAAKATEEPVGIVTPWDVFEA
jgi:hypothetical protein